MAFIPIICSEKLQWQYPTAKNGNLDKDKSWPFYLVKVSTGAHRRGKTLCSYFILLTMVHTILVAAVVITSKGSFNFKDNFYFCTLSVLFTQPKTRLF